MTKTIIVPFPHPDQDLERIAGTAIPMARMLAEASEGSILLISAVDTVPRFDPLARRLSFPSEEIRATLLQQASQALVETAKEFGDLPVKTSVVWGNPVDSIVELIGQVEPPILVVGSRGRRGLNRALYGSVALSLVHEAPCPVLVVQGLAVAAGGSLPRLTRIIVPLDHSLLSEEALEAAAALLEPGESIIHLLHVIEPSPLREWPTRGARC
jgi:universal stress protein A